MDEDFLARVTNKLKEELARTVKQTLSNSMEDEVAEGVAKVLEKRGLASSGNEDLQEKLEKIDLEIKHLKSETNRFEFKYEGDSDNNVLQEASGELDKIIKNGENATLKIMEIVESQMHKLSSQQEEIQNFKTSSPELASQMEAFCEELNNDLLKIMTALSFQDITGQQLKKFIDFIKNLENILADIYRSSEEENTQDSSNTSRVNESKSQDDSNLTSQGDIDSLMSQYGLE